METIQSKPYTGHFESQVIISTSPSDLFALIVDHKRLASHMNESSWMMGGGRMTTEVDSGLGQRVGSHIRMAGKVFGIHVSVDEVIVEYIPPRLKIWETVGQPKLLVVGHYRMRAEIEPQTSGAKLTVSIDYDRPNKGAWLGILFGGYYAKWCVMKMIHDTADNFRIL